MDALGNVFLIPSDGAFSVWSEEGAVDEKRHSVSSGEDEIPSTLAPCISSLWLGDADQLDRPSGVTSQPQLYDVSEDFFSIPEVTDGLEDKGCALPEIESICLSRPRHGAVSAAMNLTEGPYCRDPWGGVKMHVSEPAAFIPQSPSPLELPALSPKSTLSVASCWWETPGRLPESDTARNAQLFDGRRRKGMNEQSGPSHYEVAEQNLAINRSSTEIIQAELIAQLHAMKYGQDSRRKLVLPKRNLLCVELFSTGICSNKAACNSAHTLEELQKKLELRKTSLCKYWLTHRCKNEDCNFAHGEEELQSTAGVYKTTICKFWKSGQCDSGMMCRHAHGEGDLRPQNLPPHLEKKKQEQQTRRLQFERRKVADFVTLRRCLTCGLPHREEAKALDWHWEGRSFEERTAEPRLRRFCTDRGRRRFQGEGEAFAGSRHFTAKDLDLADQKRGDDLSDMFRGALLHFGGQKEEYNSLDRGFIESTGYY